MRDQIVHARTVETVLSRLAWSVVVVGVVSLAGVVVACAVGDLNLEQALLAATGTVLGTILSGATAYGSATNVGLGASRLELDLQGVEQDRPRDE